MDVDAAGRDGNKRVFYRLGAATEKPQKVCFHWRAGRCNRHPCQFLHGELPQAGSNGMPSKRPHGSADFTASSSMQRRPNPNLHLASNWGRNHGNGGAGVARVPRKTQDKVCHYWLAGNCSYGDKCRYLHSWFLSDSFTLLTQLEGHQKVISGIALPSGSDKLYSGSKDQSIRVWDCQSGQCTSVFNLGVEIGCMISEGPWLFVGIPNAVKVWNTQTTSEDSLSGPIGQVYALAVGNEMLFAGTQDGNILAWKFSAANNSFLPAASLQGHSLSVVSFVVGANRLYSGSMDHTIRVWDLETLRCIQTLTDHTSVVMSVLCWDQFLLSCSLDKTIKVWVATESGNLEVTYTHNEEHNPKFGDFSLRDGRVYWPPQMLAWGFPVWESRLLRDPSRGVLNLCGMHDAQAKPVLLCSCNDNTVHLYDLPSFSERGKIFSKEEVRAIQIGPGGLFFTGDGTGELRVWKWSSEPTATI